MVKLSIMKITAQKRELAGKKVKNLRVDGRVPASVYGPKRSSTNVQIDKKDFLKLFKEVGYNRFFDLELEGDKPAKVLVKEIQKNPVTDQLLSVSFYQVDEDRKITVEVPITFTGDSPAIKQNLGFLIHQLDRIAVHCLPKDLPTGLTIDLGTLEKPGDAVTVGQVVLPENVELDSAMDKTTALVYIGTAQKEEEVAPVAAEAAPAEGAAAAGTAAPAAEAKKEEKK